MYGPTSIHPKLCMVLAANVWNGSHDEFLLFLRIVRFSMYPCKMSMVI